MKLKVKHSAYSRRTEKQISKHNHNVRHFLAKLAVPALLAASMTTQAADTCQINWMATINAQAAMQPVELIIRNAKTQEIVMQTTNHSGVYHLPCTQYTATATIGDLTRGRNINLITPSADLIIEMGE